MARAGEDLIQRIREREEQDTYEGPRGATRIIPPDDPSRDPRRPLRIARGVSLVLVVLSLVGTLQGLLMLSIEARRWWVAAREVTRLQAEVQALRSETADLLEIAERGEDVRFREHLARRQGYVFPDEVRYVILQPLESPEPALSSP
jgi:hypothetical protein